MVNGGSPPHEMGRRGIIRVPANGISFEVATMGARRSSSRSAFTVFRSTPFPGATRCRYSRSSAIASGRRTCEATALLIRRRKFPPTPSKLWSRRRRSDPRRQRQRNTADRPRLGRALAWILAMRRPELIHRLAILNVPHPACFARELHRFHQLRKSWYMFFFQIPALPEYLLGRDHARMIGRMFRSGIRNRSRFPDDVIDVYRENASGPAASPPCSIGIAPFFRDEKVGRACLRWVSKNYDANSIPLGRRRRRPRLSHHPRHRKLRLRSYLPRPARHLPLGSTRSPRSRQRHARSLAHRRPRPPISRARRSWSLALRGRIFTPPPFSANRR